VWAANKKLDSKTNDLNEKLVVKNGDEDGGDTDRNKIGDGKENNRLKKRLVNANFQESCVQTH